MATETSPGVPTTTGATASPRPVRSLGRVKGAVTAGAGLCRGMNAWPPFLRNGIHLDGGSLFAMTDPFWMLMVMRRLGPGYVVRDKAAEIEFVSLGRTAVTAELRLRWFQVDVVGTDGAVVARVREHLYVRRGPHGQGRHERQRAPSPPRAYADLHGHHRHGHAGGR